MIQNLRDFDQSAFLFLNGLHTDWLNKPMQIASGQLIWAPIVIYFFYFASKSWGRKQTIIFGLFLALALVASDVTSSYLLKNIINRFRPCREIDLKPLIHFFGQKCGGKYGFVSSHAANSLALVLFSIRSLNFKSQWSNLFWGLPLIVGISRIYLGVHYPGDILGGFIIGAIWATIFSMMFRSYQGARRDNSQEPFLFS